MYSLSTFRGQPYVRTQRSSQFRWFLMGTGALTLGIAGSLAYNTFTNEYQQSRQIAETVVIAQQVGDYDAGITEALATADQLAGEIGDQVADPAVATRYNTLRSQARTVLHTKVDVPTRENGTNVAYIDRDVADGVVAVKAAMLRNLQTGEEQIRASHQAYQELVDAKARAAVARAELEAIIPSADQILFDTAPSADGWTYVPEDIRAGLSEAIADARNAILATEDPALTVVADFDRVAEGCRESWQKITDTARNVTDNIKMPPPTMIQIGIDENGNPIMAPAPAPEPAPAPTNN